MGLLGVPGQLVISEIFSKKGDAIVEHDKY